MAQTTQQAPVHGSDGTQPAGSPAVERPMTWNGLSTVGCHSSKEGDDVAVHVDDKVDDDVCDDVGDDVASHRRHEAVEKEVEVAGDVARMLSSVKSISTGLFVGNISLHACPEPLVDDKIAQAFNNSSRKVLSYFAPTVQNDIGKQQLLGIFWGKKSYFHHLKEYAKSVWPALRDVTSTTNGFFFFQFKTVIDMEEIIEGGPWLFQGQPIVLQKWEPGMVMRKLKHTQVPVWIKLRYLPVELWIEEGLSMVASCVGRPLYPDAITRACTRLDFARVCVMLDISSKFSKHIINMTPDEDGGESPYKVDVEYEWVPPKCTCCMTLGHAAKDCTLNKAPKMVKPPVIVYVPKASPYRAPTGVEKSFNTVTAPEGGASRAPVMPERDRDRPTVRMVEEEIETREKPIMLLVRVVMIGVKLLLSIIPLTHYNYLMMQLVLQGVLKRAAPKALIHAECDYHQLVVKDLVSEFRLHFIGLLETRKWFVDNASVGNRIWLAWDENFVDVDVLELSSQYIHVRVNILAVHEPTIFTVIYGANEVADRRDLWGSLEQLATQYVDLPWIVGGDFNAVRDLSEVCGLSGDIRMAMEEFNTCIKNAGLLPLPMQGEWFSWHNFSASPRNLWKRLDRMLTNDTWAASFLTTFYSCLTPRTFDRSSMVISGDSQRQFGGMFRFDNYLTLSPNFIPSVQNIWQHEVIRAPMYAVTQKLKALKYLFREQRWKKGNLTHNVQLAKGFLETAQTLASLNREDELFIFLEHCYRLIYSKAVKFEQIMLQQRATMEWMKGGDQYSRVFFRKIIQRRTARRILQIDDAHGTTHTELNAVSHEFVAYYQSLLGGVRHREHVLSDEEASQLILPFMPEDVKLAVFDIADIKAPRPDGFFLQDSLKLLAGGGELSVVLDKLISPCHAAFIPGRSIGDNIMLAQELFTGYNQMRVPWRCALKVDICKAYDTVEWDFLLAVLQLFGFPVVFMKWIEECVTTTSFSVGMKEKPHGFFTGARGLRQGDPLSPYLFVLVMEVMHLLGFVDHLLLFCRADIDSITVFKEGLDQFGTWSGLRLNVDKSHLIISRSAQGLKEQMLAVLGFQEGLLPRALSVYWASTFILPKGVIKNIEKRLRTFLWKGEGSSGYAKVAWNEGRLRDASIWTIPDHRGSWGWKKMIRLRMWLRPMDPWHHLGPLMARFPRGPVTLGLHESIRLSSVIQRGQWQWPLITDIQYLEITHTLSLIHGDNDRIIWRFFGGIHTIQALYRLFDPPSSKVGWALLLSGALKIPRHMCILWLAILEKLPTTDKSWLSHLGRCVLCDEDEVETHTHTYYFDVDTVANAFTLLDELYALRGLIEIGWQMLSGLEGSGG
ncbi:UNVERIFIED_CONTAM: hypothetical protein Sindi_0935400 [Sesamum indicum]